MDFTHKFASGPMPIDRLISEYFNPGKMRRYGSQAAYAGKRYSNPPFNFKEQDFLNKFKYLYPIGREYEIPREDRQKVIGTSNVNTYKRQITEAINLQSWNDLLRFEQEHPGTLALVPGPCQVCERTHEGCTRPKNQPCRHMDMMRFSLEGLGIDADTMAKFEMGLLPKWPDDGKLPQKLTAVMGILSNELIPMEEIKAFFPDAEKNFLNLAERENLDPNLLSPEIKRQSSWLDNQVRQRKALEEAEAKRLQAEQQASLPSEHLKDAPKPESELPTEHIGNKTFEAGMPNEHIVQKGSQPDAFDEDENPQAEEEEDEDKKYKWLGFKRSMDEVNQNFYNRPIRKFNVPDEEEESEEAADEEAPENTEAAAPEEAVEEAAPEVAAEPAPAAEPEAEEEDDDSGLNYSFKRPIFDDEVPNAGGIPKWKTNPALLPDEEEEEEPAETVSEPQAIMEEFVSEAAPEPEAPQPSAPAPDTMQSLLESLDVDMLKKVLAAKLMESGEMTADDLRAQREREEAQAREREREERRAALEDAMNQKRAEAEARAREEQEAAEREAARLKAEEEAKEAERVRKQEELEGMLRARLEEERARIEEEKRIEAEKKAEEERIKAEEAAKKAEEERLAQEEQARLEAQKLPEVSGLENVLGMALNIAKQVSKPDEPEEAQAEEEPQTQALAEAVQALKAEEKRQPVRHSYKWLNYKSELPDDEDEPLKDWKDR